MKIKDGMGSAPVKGNCIIPQNNKYLWDAHLLLPLLLLLIVEKK
jgi:hypothetical protein